MTSSFPIFDRSTLHIKPLSERVHDLNASIIMPLHPVATVPAPLAEVARKMVKAKATGASVIFIAGGHVVRSGVQRYIIDLMKRGYITNLCVNGAVAIHDFEFSLIGQTTESVNRYIHEGQFGLWRETGKINDIIKKAAIEKQGVGEAVGQYIWEHNLPGKQTSLFAMAHRLGVLATVHVGIGYDIVAEHPNYCGASWGETSYRDFLRFAEAVGHLEGGVVASFGSAVMGPEVYLKALAMARNRAKQNGNVIAHFTTLVADLLDLPDDCSSEPEKSDARYYFRPWKTMLVRTVRDGGHSVYVKMPHRESVPALWTAVDALSKESLT